MGTTHHDNLTTANLAATGTLTVSGAATLSSTLAVSSTLEVTGETTLTGGVTFSGALALSDTVNIGTLSSTTQTGYTLTSTNNSVLNSFADDGNATLANAVYSNIRARTMLFKACTAGTIVSMKGQIKLADEADLGPGVFAGTQGYLELYKDADVKSGGKVWGVDSSIDVPTTGTLTVASGGIMAGFHAELTGAGTATQSSGGILAGLYVDEQITTGKWGYGIYMTGGSAYQAVKIGTLSSTTAGSGITVTSGFPAAVEVHADDGDSALGSSVTARAIDARFMNYGSVAAETWGVQGKCKLSAVARTANVACGVTGSFESTGVCSTATGSGNTYCAGVMGRLGGGGTFTIGSGTQVAGVLAYYNTSITNAFTNTGTCAFLAVASEIAGTGDWDYGLYFEDVVRGGYITAELAGATALNNMELVSTDATTASSGYSRTIYANHTNTGAKTGNAEVNVISADFDASANVTTAYAFTGYVGACAGATINRVAGYAVYMDALTGTVGASSCAHLETVGGATVNDFISMRKHGGTIHAMISDRSGGATATYFLHFNGANDPVSVDAGAPGANSTHKIAVQIGSDTRYIALYSDY